MRNVVLILCLILMCILGWFYCQSYNECCVGSGSDEAAAAGTAEESAAPSSAEEGMSDHLMFKWSDNEPVFRDDWDQYKSSLIAGLGDQENLEITGLFRSEETNNTDFENLGLARAAKIKAMLVPPMAHDRVVIKSRLVDDDADRNALTSSVEFREFTVTETIDESIPNRTIVRFAFNSTNKLDDAEMEDYLDKLAIRVIASGERVRLTGHTDNIGSDQSNMVLGQRRADIIKNYLINKGVPAANVITNSRGESAPVASNETEAGRAQNRRAELEIIK